MRRLNISIRQAQDLSYPITIGTGAWERLSQCPALSSASKVLVVTDSQVGPLYLDRLRDVLAPIVGTVAACAIVAGETHKDLTGLTQVLEACSQAQLDRRSCLVALGGGVVGDVTGFAASIWMRGIPFVQLPTSLLAMADASIGGKTAVDFAGRKNQIGTFWQPSAVCIDPSCLVTLKPQELKSGFAEIIKCLLLDDEDAFATLDDLTPLFRSLTSRNCTQEMYASEQMEAQIARAIAIKAGFVAEDPRDTGRRACLNFGHTIGHAIEAASSMTVSHGEAVATGMSCISRGAAVTGLVSATFSRRLDGLLEALGYDTHPHCSRQKLMEELLGDKKRRGDAIDLVLIRDCGHPKISRISLKELERLVQRAL